MRFVVDHDYHIHSFISKCCVDERQTAGAILDYAKNNNFKKICITDHMWDSAVPGVSNWYTGQDFDHIAKILPLPQDENVKFYFGAETEIDKYFNLGATKEVIDKLDFLVVPTTHMHMKGFTVPRDCTNHDVRAQIWCDRFSAFLNMDLPWHKIGLAHITCNLISYDNSGANTADILKRVNDDYYHYLFNKCARLGLGIELNFYSFSYSDEDLKAILYPYQVAKEEGCKFYLGSDAHCIEQLSEAKKNFEHIVDLLDLKEDDKFHF